MLGRRRAQSATGWSAARKCTENEGEGSGEGGGGGGGEGGGGGIAQQPSQAQPIAATSEQPTSLNEAQVLCRHGRAHAPAAVGSAATAATEAGGGAFTDTEVSSCNSCCTLGWEMASRSCGMLGCGVCRSSTASADPGATAGAGASAV